MSQRTAPPQTFSPLRSVLKAFGGFADVSTRRGKALKKWEDVMTEGFTRLSGSDAYLRAVGRAMERSFILKAQSDRAWERTLRAARIPSATRIDEVHLVATSLDDKLDALTCQLEAVMDRIGALEAQIAAMGEAEAAAPRRRARKGERA